MAFITPEGLENIKNHKYVSGGYSMVDKYMNYYWEFCVKLIPMRMAPNLITLTGLIINIMGSLMFLPYDLTITWKFPACMLYIGASCAFIYQTLDACDGKQARRTGSSSPLGQLFDHGCDAISVFFGLNMFLYAMQSGTNYVYFGLLFSVTLTFYTQMWEEQHTHVLRTFIGYFGVTEGILLQIGFIILIGYTKGTFHLMTMGQLLPGQIIPYMPEILKNLSVAQVSVIFIVYNAILYGYLNMKQVLLKTQETTFDAMMGLLPLGIFYFSLACLYSSDWAFKYPALAILIQFPTYCLISNKQIICSLSKMKFNPYQLHPFLFLLFPINKYGSKFLTPGKQMIMDEDHVAWIVFVLSFLHYIIFIVRVIRQITNHLNIYCFYITPKTDPKKVQ